MNSLIGLWSGAVVDVDAVLPYTGEVNPFMQSWKRDMGLREAIVISNVPIYQELALRIHKGRGNYKPLHAMACKLYLPLFISERRANSFG